MYFSSFFFFNLEARESYKQLFISYFTPHMVPTAGAGPAWSNAQVSVLCPLCALGIGLVPCPSHRCVWFCAFLLLSWNCVPESALHVRWRRSGNSNEEQLWPCHFTHWHVILVYRCHQSAVTALVKKLKYAQKLTRPFLIVAMVLVDDLGHMLARVRFGNFFWGEVELFTKGLKPVWEDCFHFTFVHKDCEFVTLWGEMLLKTKGIL